MIGARFIEKGGHIYGRSGYLRNLDMLKRARKDDEWSIQHATKFMEDYKKLIKRDIFGFDLFARMESAQSVIPTGCKI